MCHMTAKAYGCGHTVPGPFQYCGRQKDDLPCPRFDRGRAPLPVSTYGCCTGACCDRRKAEMSARYSALLEEVELERPLRSRSVADRVRFRQLESRLTQAQIEWGAAGEYHRRCGPPQHNVHPAYNSPPSLYSRYRTL